MTCRMTPRRAPKPHPEAQLVLLLCNGNVVQPIWVAPEDIVDLDAAARNEAQRYIEDVLVPAVRIGVNPAARGLVGLDSWFWIDGFDGSVTAPPISAFGLTIDVRMSSGTVSWDFGDGTVEPGDLGRPYPQESTVRHVHQHDGSFAITATHRPRPGVPRRWWPVAHPPEPRGRGHRHPSRRRAPGGRHADLRRPPGRRGLCQDGTVFGGTGGRWRSTSA